MSLPNTLTISRILLTLMFLKLITIPGLAFKLWGAFIFLLASLTDFYDGYYAKKYQLESDFGRFMDPIADKFLILGAFLVFAKMQLIPLWMVVLISVREVAITAFRLIVMKKGEVLAAETLGKMKTVLQILAVSFILIWIVLRELRPLYKIPAGLMSGLGEVVQVIMLVAVVLTIISGVSYLWNNRRFLYGS